MINSGSRDSLIRKNIVVSAVAKIVGMAASFLVVPVTLSYLNNEVYGVWLVMSSIILWVMFFDIGLGNGMRNYLSASIANNDKELSKRYVSTTFFFLSLIALALAVISIIASCFIDVNWLFNTQSVSAQELRLSLQIALLMTTTLFVVKNVGMIFVSMQLPSVNDVLVSTGSLLSLIAVFIITKTVQSSLLFVVAAYTVIPVLVYTVAAIPVFRKYWEFRPSFKYVDYQLARQVVFKGLGFFVIQITSCLVIYGAANFFIGQFCGPRDVADYGISFKYFNLLSIGFTILITPYWNAYTEAYVKGDMEWIAKSFKKTLLLFLLTTAGGALMLLLANIFYSLWVDDMVTIPLMLSASTLLYVTAFNLNNCLTFLINGLNKIRIQIITSVTATLLYIIVMVLFGRHMNVCEIVLAMAVSYFAMAVVHFIQCRKFIGGTASGIWNK